jgi:hypothetical protein
MTETATAEKDPPAENEAGQKRWVFLRTHGRTFLYAYTVVLLSVTSVQALCLFFLWRPPQDWVSFTARFITSPAIAGVFAVIAASIGARQLSKQLSHTKKKAADEAWWQQFEWVTDRIISPEEADKKNSPTLPTSLAFDLMTALADIAEGGFQESAVGGILDHYLRDFPKQQEGSGDPEETEETNQSVEREETSSNDGPSMDATAAKSLRNLISHLPESSSSTESARRALAAYYVTEVAKALRHRGFDVTQQVVRRNGPANVHADIIASRGSEKVIVDVRQSLLSPTDARRASFMLEQMMRLEDTRHGVIVTPPSKAARLLSGDLSRRGIHVVEWEPGMRSFELLRQFELLLSTPKA